jgi:kumamolisin
MVANPRRAGRLAALAVVVVLLAVAVPAVAALPPVPPAALPTPVAPFTSDLPAPLLAPLADRMGLDPALATGVPDSTVATGNASAVLTLWPSSPSFYLTPGPGTPALSPAEVADEYGLSPSQYANLAEYFVHQGLTITHLWPDRLFLSVEGPVGQVAAAFRTTERSGTYQGAPVEFATTAPSLPAPYASEVAAVSGLSTDLSPFTLPLVEEPTAVSPDASDGLPLQGRTSTTVWPSAVHLIYGMDALYNFSGSSHLATGIGIALLLWGDGYDPNDIRTFFSTDYPSEFPAPTVRYFPVDGAPVPSATALSDPSTGPQELTLDIEWAGSAAPNATLDAVYAPDGPAGNGYSPTDASMIDALNEAVNSISGVDVLSMSFGTNDGADSSFQSAFETAFHQASLEGITVVAASGDNGGTTEANCGGTPAPQFPATSPMVLAVGGTAPVLAEDGLGTVTGLDSEPAWDKSGGGFSTTYAAPSWQLVGSAAAPIKADGMRGVPDVAGPASDNGFYFNGGPDFGEGTSFATPMWAGLIAEMDAVRGHPLGFVTPHLYAVGAQEDGSGDLGLVPITAGNNCLANAGPGWDEVTGWGSPRALPLFESIAGTYVATALSASPAPVAPGGTLSTNVQASNATSGHGLGGLAVYIELDSVNYDGPCGGTLATASGATNATGGFSVGLPIPGCYFGTVVSVSVTVSGDGYYGSNQTNVAVNLDGLSGVLAALQQYPYNVIGFVLIMIAATGAGLFLSARHRRRMQGPPPSNPPPGATAPGPLPPAAPLGPSTPGPLPYDSSPVAAPTGSVASTAVRPATVAAAVSGPAGDPARLDASPACVDCGTPRPAGAAECPSCGRLAPV